MENKLRLMWAIDPQIAISKYVKTIGHISEPFEGGIEIRPVSVVDPLTYKPKKKSSSADSVKEQVRESLCNINEKLNAKISTATPKVILQKSAKDAPPLDPFLNYVKDQRADFLMMGSRYEKNKKTYYFGNFSRQILNQAPVPVIITHPNAHEKVSSKNILFSSDLSRESMLVFIKLCFLAKNMNMRISLGPCHQECIQNNSYSEDCAFPIAKSPNEFLNIAKKCNVKADYIDLALHDVLLNLKSPPALINKFNMIASYTQCRMKY